MATIFCRLIDAYKRGYITEEEYNYYLEHGYTNDSLIQVEVNGQLEKWFINDLRLTNQGLNISLPNDIKLINQEPSVLLQNDLRLIKRDPNVLTQYAFELEGTDIDGTLETGDNLTVKSYVDGKICGFDIIMDPLITTDAEFDIYVDSSTFPPSSSICSDARPTLSSETHKSLGSSDIETWSLFITKDDYITVKINSITTTATRAMAYLTIEPSTEVNI